MSASLLERLSHVALFRPFPRAALLELASLGHPRTFQPEELLYRQGEVASSLYVLLDGYVTIERTHPQLLRPLEMGEVFGAEVVGAEGVLERLPRRHAARARVATETLEVLSADLVRLLRAYPAAAVEILPALAPSGNAGRPPTERAENGPGTPRAA